ADMTKVQAAIARADWSFTTEVNANPTLVAQVPANNSNGIVLDQDLQMTFNMPVEAGSGNIQLHAADGSLVLNFDVKGADVTFANDVVNVALPQLAEGKQFYVIIPATAIRNKTYTPEYFGGITVPYTWKFTTGDFTAPTVTANPATGNAMPLTFNVTLTFNEKVTGVNATTLAVSKGTINTVSNEATGTIYVVNITAPSLAEVILTVPATVVDLAGNKLAVTTFTYTVDNFNAPKLVTWTPADGSIGLAKDTSLVMTFDKPVMAGTGKINVYNSLNELFKSYTLTAANIVGNKVTLPITGLASETTYVVLFEEGIVKDALGLPVAALIDPTVWNFTIGDNIAPTVASITPATSTNAATSFEVTIVFSEDVVKVAENVTVNKGTVTVTGSGKTYVATIKGVDADVITMTVGTGVKDASMRNNLATAATRTYTIGDHVAPTLVVTPPVAPVATVFTVGLKFSEPVSGVLGAVTVTGGTLTTVSGLGDTYTLTVSAIEQTLVTIVLSNTIKDLSLNMNPFAGQTLTYTTGDFTAPQLVTWTPLSETTTDNHPTFKMTFNENVAVGDGGKLTVYKVLTTTPVLEIPITAAMISGKVVTVTYTTANGLDKNTNYYVKVDGLAIEDIAGNKFSGVNDATAWTFKTGPNFLVGVDPSVNVSLEFKVYPNPFVDVVNLVAPSKLSKVVVTNIAGQVVKQVVNPANSIQLNELRSGIYFISLYTSDNVIAKTVKIVKR
ncbi:MAG: Ig-like domain-containing protein, partial [Bacteroidota bacterium]|nr:Ig-like domain-containing protein [Bacteroidota bacterium]